MEELFKRQVLTNIGKYTRKIFFDKTASFSKEPFSISFPHFVRRVSL